MKKRIAACLLAIFMVLQILSSVSAFPPVAEAAPGNLVEVGELTDDNFPEIKGGTSSEKTRDMNKSRSSYMMRSVTTYSVKNKPKGSEYVEDQNVDENDKPKYWAKISGKLKTVGIGGNFDWNKIFGRNSIKLYFIQIEASKRTTTNPLGETGISFILEVSRDGTYKWSDRDGNPTLLPLYDPDGKPYSYKIKADRELTENAKLITSIPDGSYGKAYEDVGDKKVVNIIFNVTIYQLASTKFVSDWKTTEEESSRPGIEGYFDMGGEDENTNFNFPKNNTDVTIFRESFLSNFEENEDKVYYSLPDDNLKDKPKTVVVKTDTTGINFDKANNRVKSGDHTYKYELDYDIYDGGKLTMTEILPITFDANGGKFASITDENAKQEIVKEVEYGKDLKGDIEEPKKDFETFKGWAETKDGKPLSEYELKTSLNNITKAKTFYAVWGNNDIQACLLYTSDAADETLWV